ncbi:hypothetical protein AB0K05_29250 [Nonomuraea sp. NPDC049486]|uniref:PGN_0703 family putative restriction endonuclease n=1 Tax=Nonomuraea sp. NPDC049486 TaxID=3155773 RepID=UPI00341450BD
MQPSQLTRTELQHIGPQRPGESGFAARARFHQSWYRYYVLGLRDYGVTSHHTANRPLGCILTSDDAAEGYNFLSDAAKKLYSDRRKQGWGIDPVRTTSNMTSSQALTLNILGPLQADTQWATRVFAALLGENLDTVDQLLVEYDPPDKLNLTGDRTIIDGWITGKVGGSYVSAVIEVKYIDRFSSRYIDITTRPQYRQLADSTGSWDLDVDLAKNRAINQLVRCHGIGIAMTLRDQHESMPKLLIFHHPEDPRTGTIVHLYKKLLRDPEACIPISLDTLFNLMRRLALYEEQRQLAATLTSRYISHGLSEEAWRLHRAHK